MVTRNLVDGVHVRYEAGEYVPVVCVKVKGRLLDRLPADLVDVDEQISGDAYAFVEEQWWEETPKALVAGYLAPHFDGEAEARGCGRSNGWLGVHNIGTPDEWTPRQLAAWKVFESAIRESIDSAEKMWHDEIRERL